MTKYKYPTEKSGENASLKHPSYETEISSNLIIL